MTAPHDDGAVNATEPPINEGSGAATYRHALRSGFPKSMLAPAASGGKLIALLRKRGLTTSVIKDVLALPWVRRRLGKTNGRREAAVVELLSNPYSRADFFVWAAERRAGYSTYYSLSPEFAIVTAFEANWQEIDFDEDVLRAECDKWQRIKQKLAEREFKDARSTTLAVFMIWPKVRLSLECWESLNAGMREEAAHAAFSLSTLARDDWFISKAIELVPDLGDDLGGLLSPLSTAKADDDVDVEASPQNEAGADDGTTPTTDLASKWAAIGEELAGVVD